MIKDNVVMMGPALAVPGHLSFSQFVIERLRQLCEVEDTVALVRDNRTI